ncbi:unnamed protein product [Adineta steineri]|uniref:Uncharacterized protein n=1 Tax=Adineta steineri TaxID=433720 RepID=A0A815FU15_9BILA|nr:unnamed protein product [Adineta steineri]CAF1329121.1 unnamed protein product [Adineta steineri]CAF1533107.1 unnamed protein product [Adineta steineri]CAF1588687.1 unnamed protein product [Adineta steineri]
MTSSTTSSSTTTSSTTSTTTTSTTTTTTSTTTSVTTTAAFNINLVTNGDAETGSCQVSGGVTSPVGWNYNGPITQVIYNNPTSGCMASSDPGPSDRGQCYFYGQQSTSTSMWQTINLINEVSPLLIDNQSVKFNLSAWIGGYINQDDTAVVSVTFNDANNTMTGNITSIGPVYAVDRSSITSFIFQQANDFVPIGARAMTVFVTLTRSQGAGNQGSVDDIAVILYQ